jgi:uncharacterized protein
MRTNAIFCIALCACLAIASSPTLADWFVSSETKALIAKAEAGDLEAQFRVGNAYDFGKGAPRDRDEAVKWYTMAAERNHSEAQNSLGSIFQEQKNYALALKWYERASLEGHALATNSLAYLYDLGLGVPQDRRRGFELYSRAADLGWAEAMWNIANMYGAGQLGEPNMVLACVWSKRAERFASSRDTRLREHLVRVISRIERDLTEEQRGSCGQQADSWSPPGIGKVTGR